MTYYLNLNRRPYQNLLSGKKNIEIRANKPKYQSIVVGDTIIFSCDDIKNSQKISKKVTKVELFSNIEDVFLKHSHEDAIPNFSLNETVNTYYQYYPKEVQKKFGIKVIVIE